MIKEYKIKIETKDTAVFKTGDGYLFKENNLKLLYLRNNQISKIENLNKNLEKLELDNNQISKIENLNENLEELWLNNNHITKIENLNKNLKWLDLDNNPLKEITKKSYNLIKKNKIKVFGIDVDKLKIVENEKC